MAEKGSKAKLSNCSYQLCTSGIKPQVLHQSTLVLLIFLHIAKVRAPIQGTFSFPNIVPNRNQEESEMLNMRN